MIRRISDSLVVIMKIFYFNILLKCKCREVCCENKSVNMSDAWFGSCITHFLLLYSIFNLISVDWVRKNQKLPYINFSYWTNYRKSDCKLFFVALYLIIFLYCHVIVGNLYRCFVCNARAVCAVCINYLIVDAVCPPLNWIMPSWIWNVLNVLQHLRIFNDVVYSLLFCFVKRHFVHILDVVSNTVNYLPTLPLYNGARFKETTRNILYSLLIRRDS